MKRIVPYGDPPTLPNVQSERAVDQGAEGLLSPFLRARRLAAVRP